MASNVLGYLLPNPTPAPLEGQEFNRFVQQFIVGITGLDGKYVRQRWQPEPPNIPDAGVAWCAIGVNTRRADTFAYAWLQADDSWFVQRHERMDLLASFYDLGTNGLADEYAAKLRDGLSVPQNLEPLFLAGMGLVATGDIVTVPSLLKERWLYRADLSIEIARCIERVYPVLPLDSANATLIISPDGQERTILAEAP